ncbi:MAG: lipid-A-disaccharide synthase [Pseudomonadota bacterium]
MRVFLIAGEPSGDALGGALMAGLKALVPGAIFLGVGGPKMQDEGLVSLFPMEELSVMGLLEVLPKYFELKRRIDETAQAAMAAAPDVIVTIDSPDFCLRVVKRVRAARPGQRVVHYVAPSVWAWRPKRAQKMAPLVDQVLALLPFEPPYMEAAGMRCDFVGHPVAAEPVPTTDEVDAFRAAQGLQGAKVLAVLPGSRKGEVARLGPRFGAALARIVDARPGIRVILPTVPHLEEMVREITAGWPGAPCIITSAGAEKRAAFAAADAALAASGTVSLELAAVGTPMVIAYDVNRLTRMIASRMLLIDTFTLVNLVSETRAVPEFIGERCVPGLIAPGVLDVLDEPDAQADAMATTMERLGRGADAPGTRAAHAVLVGAGIRVPRS